MTSLSERDPAPRVTIRDVASLAGVGTKTVSRVVNAEPNVSPSTASRVREAIATLGWEPDTHAANLRRTVTRTRSIGLLLGSVANPFSAAIHRAVEDVAVHRDVAVFASSLDEDPERELAAVEAFVRRRVDGLMLTCVAQSQSYLDALLRPGMPALFLDRPPRDFAGDAILSDSRSGAAVAVSHLIGIGHRRIALLFDRHDIWTATERRAGAVAALDEHGLSEAGCAVVYDLETPAQAEEAVLRLLSTPDAPTAIFASQNLITIGAIRALRRLRRQHEVALVGFDDIELADLLEPGVTVVAQQPSEIGHLAAERFFELLGGSPASAGGPRAGQPAPPEGLGRRILVPTRLIPRGSGELRPPR